MRKPILDRAVIKSVSMPLRMFDVATQRQQLLQMPSFSDYIQKLIREDTLRSVVRQEDKAA